MEKKVFNLGFCYGVLQEIPDTTSHIQVFHTKLDIVPTPKQAPGNFKYYISPRNVQIRYI